MKHFKKLLIMLLAAIATVCLASGLVACGNGNDDTDGTIGGGAVPLIAPREVTITDNVLSWKAVTYAEGYVVYENGEIVSEQVETSYTIEHTVPGTYTYAVKATTTADGRTDSPLSSEVEYKIDPIKLAAPVISINAETAVISWSAVEYASSYDIYENGVKYDSTTELYYEITNKTLPEDLVYNVRAKSSNSNKYPTSDDSNSVTYRVPVHATITVEFPEEFEGSVKVEIFDLNSDSQESVAQSVIGRSESFNDGASDGYSGFGSEIFTLAWGSYIAKVTDGLGNNYAATWARISTDKRIGTINIVSTQDNGVLELGTQTIHASIGADDQSVTLQYLFVAGASDDHAHSIFVDENTYGLQITVGGRIVINTANRIFRGSFSTEEGETVLVTVTVGRQTNIGAEEDDFELEIVNYEERTPLRILPWSWNIDRFEADGYANYVNAIYDSCVCTLEVKTAGTYTFLFMSGMAGNTFITLTVNGQEFDLSGGGSADVYLEANDNVRVQIDLRNLPSEYISLFVYMK